MAPIAQVMGARRGLFASSDRRHSDPQTKGQVQPPMGQTAKGATGSGWSLSYILLKQTLEWALFPFRLVV